MAYLDNITNSDTCERLWF